MAERYRYGPGFERYYYGAYGPYFGRTTRLDDEIKEDIHSRLTWDSWVDAGQVKIDVKNGVVTLTGEVDSIVEKRAAGDDAWDTPGVLDVSNMLKVRQPVMQR
ncbi:MAG TPA: BON domain-containing protein [Anaerolineae bacterium]|nr:BON domain-containing protein [Anaerolineae bacterium]HOQ98911.1 BON domain-containing protein [Anaerolineae bacterium]HPL26507.1 BON domain-containing protein [Anaerolineae bacterium]